MDTDTAPKESEALDRSSITAATVRLICLIMVCLFLLDGVYYDKNSLLRN